MTVEQYQDIIRAVHDELSVRDELRSDLQRSENMSRHELNELNRMTAAALDAAC